MYLHHAEYDLALSGLRDPKRKFKLAHRPGVVVGSADGPSADNGHPCGNNGFIDLFSGGEDEEPALSGKENNRTVCKKKSSTQEKKAAVKKQRTSTNKTLASMVTDDDTYALQLAVAREKNDLLEMVVKGTYYYCALFIVTINSCLFLLLYPLS